MCELTVEFSTGVGILTISSKRMFAVAKFLAPTALLSQRPAVVSVRAKRC
jgi:hypothetical protein